MNLKYYQVNPESSLGLLSIEEMEWLTDQSKGSHIHELLRRCILAVLNSGSEEDNVKKILAKYKGFDVRISWKKKGIIFELINPPSAAFVDGEMIRGIRGQISAVVRDLVYSKTLLEEGGVSSLNDNDMITDYVFKMLRNTHSITQGKVPNLVVCWGGHSISEEEYLYTKDVGYQLGLRKLDICTGCGAGAMKGPMKGATIGHAKQRVDDALYLGITEPGIISSESPNPIVNHLVIMPDIEKRLEVFLRLAHGVIIFPGGAGTAEELLYLLGVFSHPDNHHLPLPIILTGPESSRIYFDKLMQFIKNTLGEKMIRKVEMIIGDPATVARRIRQGVDDVTLSRLEKDEAFHFNWRITIDKEWQKPFVPTHESMAALNLSKKQPIHILALQLRKAFSGIVAGNVKPSGIKLIEEHGPFVMKGGAVLKHLNELLQDFVKQDRMLLSKKSYKPCFKIETS